MENMKKKFTGTTYGKYMWPATRAYTTKKFNRLMDKVIEAHPDVVPWLKEHYSLLWARSGFKEEIKCDYINNNLAESWNAWIQEHKGLPVDTLLMLLGRRQ
jgi:hypothetical protein